MNNPNPFLPQSSFLQQKDKARKRLRLAVFVTLSVSVVGLMALLIQGCRKPPEAEQPTAEDTNTLAPPEMEQPTNVPDTNLAQTPVAPQPPPVEPTPPPPATVPPPEPTPAPAAAGQEYTIVRGDTFAGVAKRFGVSVRAIQDANPNVDPRRLKIGQKIQVPAPSGGVSNSTAPAPETAAAGGASTYKVRSGDTLSKIAKRHGTSVKAIISANHLKTTRIRVGQVLRIPTRSAPAPAVEPGPAPVPAPVTPAAPAPEPAPATGTTGSTTM